MTSETRNYYKICQICGHQFYDRYDSGHPFCSDICMIRNQINRYKTVVVDKSNNQTKFDINTVIGWKIFASAYDPLLTKKAVLNLLEHKFRSSEWELEISKETVKIVQNKTQFEVFTDFSGEQLIIEHEKLGFYKKEDYAFSLFSHSFTWKAGKEDRHKNLMFKIFKQLPSRWIKACGYIESSNSISLAYWDESYIHVEREDKGLTAKSYKLERPILIDTIIKRRKRITTIRKSSYPSIKGRI